MIGRSKLLSFCGNAVLVLAIGCSDHDQDELHALVDQAAKLEQDAQFHEATSIYKGVLGRDLAPSFRATVRYGLARCQIAGNDLNGALETLDDLTSENVKDSQMDIGPLYLDLGDKYFAKDDKKKAQIAWQLGRGVSPARVVEFNQRIEKLIPPAPEKGDQTGK